MLVSFRLNGDPVELEVGDDELLLDLVRELGLTGTKEGCGVGVCGLCSVLVDDRAVSSCLYLCGFLDGAAVWTIEGLARREPGLVEAFVGAEAMQCGICTPGQLVAAAALRRSSPGAGEAEVREHLAGNLCRCTGYGTIVEAVMRHLAEGEGGAGGTSCGDARGEPATSARRRRPAPGGPRLVAPATLAEACAALREPGAVAVSGGTALGLLLRNGLVEATALVWLGRVAGLSRLEATGDGGVRIGAAVTLARLAADPFVRRRCPSLAWAASRAANPRVRAVATLGGHLAHADARQDLPPVLIALDARVEIAGGGGRPSRRLSVDRLFRGVLEADLEPGEVIAAVEVPARARRREHYVRFSPGSAEDYPTVGAAAALELARDGTVAHARVALGAVGPTPLLVAEASDLLVGRRVGAAELDRLGEAARAAAGAVGDHRGSAAYKAEMGGLMARRAVAAALAGEPAG